MRTTTKYMLGLLTALTITAVQPVWAAGPPAPSIFNNPLTLTFIILMVLLLVIIGILANILIGAADVKLKKKKKAANPATLASVITGLLLLAAPALFAQDATGDTANAVTTGAKTIAGMPSSTFYILATVMFLELFIILALLINIKFLLKAEKDKITSETETEEEKANKLTWWDKFNALRPVTEESSLDLGHDYDGIRELNNRLPGWWLYGFYGCILFAGVYLYRFHVSHTAPSSIQEYEQSVVRAESQLKEFIKKQGDAVDETNVKLLTGAEDLAAGKALFVKSCAACHLESGAGIVGPNLTDDYWLHGNDIKSMFKVVRYGINAMPAWQTQMSNKQIAQVSSYIKTLHGTNPPNPKAPQGTLMKEETVPSVPAADSAAQTKKVAMN
ncbi:MAG TPA: cbb3-type cytochrome c oxidase N-terminal domain-containing protein [Chitinophagaceae bacterium]|nr:cbb3-type cytochrome c oxidase N-terminal domain-containing protein [Chitinophagaceae bacterium]